MSYATDFRRLQLCLLTRQNVPAFVGAPGEGKTSMAHAIAQHLGLDFFHSGAPGMDPCDINGVQVYVEGGLHQYPHHVLVDALKNNKPMLFWIDEVTSGSEQLFGALQRATDKHSRMGEFRIPDNFRVGCSGNGPGTATAYTKFTPAFANRVTHIKSTGVSDDEFTDLYNNLAMGLEPPTPKLFKPMTPDEELLAKQHAFVLFSKYRRQGTFQLRETKNDTIPDDVAQREPLAYATPRSWHTCIDLLATCLHYGCLDDFATLAEGTIGVPQGRSFYNACIVNDILDPIDILDGVVTWEPDPKRPDLIYAQLNSIAMAVGRKHKNMQSRIDVAIGICKDIVFNKPGMKHLVRTALNTMITNTRWPANIVLKDTQWIIKEYENFGAIS